MSEKNITNRPDIPDTEPQIIVNEYGATKDSAVVIEEADRTVLLTNDETVVIEKATHIDIPPANRPRKVYRGMWGPAEIAAAAFSGLAILAVIFVYFIFVRPSATELQKNRAERDRLEIELTTARERYGNMTSTETQVAKLVASVDDFESRYLPVSSTGRTAIYQRINGLIAGYGLLNTSGPDFAPLEIDDQNGGEQADDERGRSKFRSLFPGVYVTMTVEGSYQNLRRFIRDIETGNDFVLISSIELEPSDSPQKQKQPDASQQPGTIVGNPAGFPGNPNFGTVSTQGQLKPQGKTHGEVVSLRLEMAAYFRRMNAMPAEPEMQNQ